MIQKALCRGFSHIPFGIFKAAVDSMLQKHAPIKKTYIWANQASLMNNKIEKEIMRRTHLIKKNNGQMPTEQPITNNITIVLAILEEKKTCFNNLKISDVTDNETFWKKLKSSFFSEKGRFRNKIYTCEKRKNSQWS